MSTTSATSVEINLQPAVANSNGSYGPERRPRSSSPRADPALKVPAAHNVRPVSVQPPPARVPPPAVGPMYMDPMQRATVGQAKGDGRGTGRASLASDSKLPAAGVEGGGRGTGRASLACDPKLPETVGGREGAGPGAVGDSADSTGPKPEPQGVGGCGLRGRVAAMPPGASARRLPSPRPHGASAVGQPDMGTAAAAAVDADTAMKELPGSRASPAAA